MACRRNESKTLAGGRLRYPQLDKSLKSLAFELKALNILFKPVLGSLG